MRIVVLAINVFYIAFAVIGIVRSHRGPDVDVLFVSAPFVAALLATFIRNDGWFALITSTANLVVTIAIGYFAWALIRAHSPRALDGPFLLIAGITFILIATAANSAYLFTRFMQRGKRQRSTAAG